ncbi:Rab-GAP TBC domain-containing protein [Entamoeba marina]
MSGTPVVLDDDIVIFQKRWRSPSAEDNDTLKDMGLFGDVYINLQSNKRIYGALCLFKKRKQLFISFLPMEVRTNASILRLINFSNDSQSVDLKDYKSTTAFRDISAYNLVVNKTGTVLTFETLRRVVPIKLPSFEFAGKSHKDNIDKFISVLKQDNSTIEKDDNKKGRYVVTHKYNSKTDASVFHEKAYLRLTNPLLVERRNTLLKEQQVSTLQPVNKELLQSLMEEDGFINTSNMNVIRKVLLYRGCDAEVREFVWKLCLGYYEGKNTRKERMEWDKTRNEDYEKVKSTWKNIIPEMKENWDEFNKTEEQIRKDVVRTDRDDSKFINDDCPNLQTLSNVLMTSSMYNMKIGYMQGMNDIVAVLMKITTNESSLFWLFQSVMNIIEGFYCSKASHLYSLLDKLQPIVQMVHPGLSSYLKEHDIDYIFTYKWIVLLFKRYIGDDDLLRLWDAIFAFPSSKFYYFVVVALIKEYADDIIDNQLGFDELYMLFQNSGQKIPVEIIFDADLILQEFMHIADPHVIKDFMKKETFPLR